MDQRFSLLPMPSMMVSILALARISLMVPNCLLILTVVRSVGVSVTHWGFCSVTPHLQLRTGTYGPVTLESATVPVSELLAVMFLLERSVGPIHIHSDCKYVCAGRNKLTQRTKRRAHVTLWPRLQKALLRHQGTVEISWCKAHITAGNFNQFGMTAEILVGNAVADALAKKGASVFSAVNDWGKIDRITWAVQQRIYATSILAAQASPHNTTAHPARRVRKRERTSLENASSHSLVFVGRGYHFHVCELSTPARGALGWLRNTICSGPPNSRPDMPFRVGHQTLHESHQLSFHRGVFWCAICGHIGQHAAGKKSRAIGLVNECPRHMTRAGRDVLARIEWRLSPKASADWPLMRETISMIND